ncbi:hypothetical protein BX600DRAFT_438418 [Xylariales sp. PMI_506]|nr:hypothetical protein BX600DRAFT_438418 [Xylariales sp. PMI_506]
MENEKQQQNTAQQGGATMSPSRGASITPKPTAPKPQSKQPPPGYKVLRVRDKDGKIITVLRKLTPEELTAQSSAKQGIDASNGTASTTKAEYPAAVQACTKEKADASNSGQPSDNSTVSEKPQPPSKLLNAAEGSTNSKSRIAAQESAPERVTNSLDPTKTPKDVAKCVPGSPHETPEALAESTHDENALQAALEQQHKNRKNRAMGRFKTSIWQGFVRVTGSAIPTIDIGDIHHGDQVISDYDSDISEDHDDDDNDAHDHSESLDGSHHRHSTDSNERGEHHDVTTIQTTAALQAVGATATAFSNPKTPTPATANVKEVLDKKKVTYKVTEKDAQEVDEKATAALQDKPLTRHWTGLSYYLMASLSIILPSLFLILGIAIALMRNKYVTSDWRYMEQAIKVAVSAWPIVFAAVVAQCLKTWASYRVERGIRLMDLEQLVGANSFGSAIKQPLVLHRIGFLSFLIFLLWCLSPLGSQALQHVYGDTWEVESASTTVYMPNMTSNNTFLPENINQPTRISWNQMVEEMSVIYQSTFVTGGGDYEDAWQHPLMFTPSPDSTQFYVSALGVPVFFNASIFNSSTSTNATSGITLSGDSWEMFSYIATSSMINFTCPSGWSNQSYFDVYYDNSTRWSQSQTSTLWVKLTQSNETEDFDLFDTLVLASLNSPGTTLNSSDYEVYSNATFSYIECKMTQLVFTVNVTCGQAESGNGYPECWTEPTPKPNITQTINGIQNYTSALTPWIGWGSNTKDSDLESTLLRGGLCHSAIVNIVLVEIFLSTGTIRDRTYSDTQFCLSCKTGTNDMILFVDRLQYLFNTWVNMGYCPICNSYWSWSDVKTGNDTSYFISIDDVQWWYTRRQIYTIDWTMLGLYFACAIILFVAGLASTIIDGMLVVPDVLGYASTAARNSRYLQLPKTSSKMSAPQRVREVGSTVVMMQDVKGESNVGRIALGNKHEKSTPLRSGRLYR